jgi:single-strand DNA-binding protein
MRLLEQNFVLLSGRLGQDPDFRVTAKGTPICHFTLAVNRRFKDTASGEWKDDTAWVPVDVWGDAAERLRDKLKKGSPVHVEGRLKSREYEDKSGQKRKVLDVVARRVQFLTKSGAGAGASAGGGKPAETDLEEVPF